MADLNDERPLRTLSEVYKELAATIDSQTADVEVAKFSHAFSLISPFFSYFSLAFKFAEIDVVAKVNNLTEASKYISTLEALLERDIEANTVRKVGSHSRNLLKTKRAVDMVRALFENILATEESYGRGDSLREPASKAYAQVFDAHHGWAIRKVAGAAMYSLSTISEMWKMLNEDAASAKVEMEGFIHASTTVCQYIERLFLSRELGIDW